MALKSDGTVVGWGDNFEGQTDLPPMPLRSVATASGPGGTTIPWDPQTVYDTYDLRLRPTPDPGYEVASVSGCGGAQEFGDLYLVVPTEDCTVTVTFQAAGAPQSHTITATAGTGGSVSPSGAVIASHGAAQAFSITPTSGHAVADVLVDGVSVGAVTKYTFSNVTANHTIAVEFKVVTATVTVKGSSKAFKYNGAAGSVSFSVLGAPSTPLAVECSVSGDAQGWLHVDPVSVTQTISLNSKGQGKGSIKYRVDPQPSSFARSGILTIGGIPFTVTQAGAPCALVLNPTRTTIKTGEWRGGSFTVTAPEGCSWTASADPKSPWIQLISDVSGEGAGVLVFTAVGVINSKTVSGKINVSTVEAKPKKKTHTVTLAPIL
jgi:hypothetical protein